MNKILVILSEYGYWGEELTEPMEVLEAAGYSLDFATPNGKTPRALPPSMDCEFIDPPLGKTVTTAEMAEKVRKLENSGKLENPINISKLMPERPYISGQYYLRELEKYYHDIEDIQSVIDEYDALLLVGGSGPIVDMVNNQRVHDIILSFVRMNKLVAAECYGVACLAFARDMRLRKSIINGKHVTGHPIEYDYKDGTGFLNTDLNMGPPPYPLEYVLRDAVGEKGQYHGNVGNRTSVILDYPFLTSRSTASSRKCGEVMLDCLKNGITRYGF